MKRINFIPADLRPRLEIPGILIPMGLFLLFVGYAGGTVTWDMISKKRAEYELTQIETENTELVKKLDSLTASKQRMKMDEAIGGMKKLLEKKNYWSGLFREITVLIPEGVWLTGFSDTKEADKVTNNGSKAATATVALASPPMTPTPGVNLGGAAPAATPAPVRPFSGTLYIQGESSSHEIIAQFLSSLEKSHHFSGVQLKYTEKEANIRPARYKFEFSVPIRTVSNGGS